MVGFGIFLFYFFVISFVEPFLSEYWYAIGLNIFFLAVLLVYSLLLKKPGVFLSFFLLSVCLYGWVIYVHFRNL